MKKLFQLLLIFTTAFVLVACEKNVDPTLSSPKNVVVSEAGIVTWSSVTDADYYILYIDTRGIDVYATTFDLNTEPIAVGERLISVVAVKGEMQSLPSTVVTFTVELLADPEVILSSVLSLLDPSYVSGMTEDDFDDEWEYNQYQSNVRMATAYANATANVRMTEEDAVGFFGDLSEMAQGVDETTNLSSVMTDLEMFDTYNMTPYATANVLYNLLMTQLEISITDAEDQIAYYEDRLSSIEEEILTITASTEYINARTYILSFGSQSNAAAVYELFSGSEMGRDLYYQMNNLAWEIINTGYANVDIWFEADETFVGYVYDLANILTDMYMTDGISSIEAIAYGGYLEFMWQLYDLNNSWVQDSLDRYNEQLETMEAALAAFEANEVITIQSLELVIDYLMTFKDSIPQNVIGLLDNAMAGTELSMTEMLLIKDEIVGILHDTLPSATDFAVLYTTLFYVGGAITGVDMSSYISQATYLAELDYQVLDIFLTLVEDIDQTFVEDVMDMVDEINMSEGSPEKVVDLGLYVLIYIDDFKTANIALFDELDLLLGSDSAEALYQLALENIIAQMENDPYVDPVVVDILEQMVDEYDTLMAGLDVFKQIGMNVVSELIDTEAAIFYAIIEAQNMQMNDMTEILTLIEELISDFVGYNNAIVGELDQASVEAVLSMTKIVLVAALGESGLEGDFDALFDTLLPHVSTVIANVITLEQAILSAADGLDLVAIFSDENLEGPEMGAVMALIQALDVALTPANETLFVTTVNVAFNNIIKNTTIMQLTGAPLLEVNEAQTMILDGAADMFAMIHEAADYDLANLTPEEVENLESIFMLLQSVLGGMGGNDDPEISFENAIVIFDGQTLPITFNDDYVYLEFTPQVSGFYTISSGILDESIDPYVSLLDMYGEYVDNNDDGGLYWNFELTAYLNAYETYYFEIGSYDSYVTFDVTLD